MLVLPFISHLLAEDPGRSILSVVAILDFGWFPRKLDYLCRFNRHPTPKMPKLNLSVPPARWVPGPLIPSVVGILPHFDGFLPILSKLKYLYKFNRHPTPKMPKLTLCLPPARWGPRAHDSQCGGNIASFRWIPSNFVKTRSFMQI